MIKVSWSDNCQKIVISSFTLNSFSMVPLGFTRNAQLFAIISNYNLHILKKYNLVYFRL